MKDDDDLWFRGHKELVGRPSPPSPGPWRVKEYRVRDYRAGNVGTEYIVLDANDKRVATCDRRDDAYFIADHGPPLIG